MSILQKANWDDLKFTQALSRPRAQQHSRGKCCWSLWNSVFVLSFHILGEGYSQPIISESGHASVLNKVTVRRSSRWSSKECLSRANTENVEVGVKDVDWKACDWQRWTWLWSFAILQLSDDVSRLQRENADLQSRLVEKEKNITEAVCINCFIVFYFVRHMTGDLFCFLFW